MLKPILSLKFPVPIVVPSLFLLKPALSLLRTVPSHIARGSNSNLLMIESISQEVTTPNDHPTPYDLTDDF